MEHDEQGAAEVPEQGVGRRTVIRGAAAGLAGAWAVPVITSFTSPAFAAGSNGNPNPECRGSNCGNFIPCSSNNPDCVCTTTSTGGGFCIPGSTPCSAYDACGPGDTCPAGQVCVVDSCCGGPKCVPTTLNGQCPPSADGGAGLLSTMLMEREPGTTFGH